MICAVNLRLSQLPHGRSRVTAIVFFLLVLAGCDKRPSPEVIRFTQCIESLDKPFSRKDQFYKDSARRCYGQRWAIPQVYYGYKYMGANLITETIVIQVDYANLKPGLAAREQLTPSLNDVHIHALHMGAFEDLARQTKDIFRIANGFTKSNRTIYGLNVYEQLKHNSKRQSSNILLLTSNSPPLFAKCILFLDKEVNASSPQAADGDCEINSNVDDRLYLQYHLSFSEMQHLQSINADLINFIRRFIVN